MWERLLGKQVESCALASKKWWALAALLQMTPIRAGFARPKACDIIAEDAFSVASQHSSVLFFRSAGNMWQELKGRYSWISQLRLEDLKTVTFYFWTLQEDRARHKVTLSFWTFPEFLAFLVIMTSSELLSCSHGADMWNPNLFPVRSLCLLIHPLNWKSPHHARKCGAASWNL